MIKVQCKCDARLRINDKHAGKAVKCPKCASRIQVPEPEPLTLFPQTSAPQSQLPHRSVARNSASETEEIDRIVIRKIKPFLLPLACILFTCLGILCIVTQRVRMPAEEGGGITLTGTPAVVAGLILLEVGIGIGAVHGYGFSYFEETRIGQWVASIALVLFITGIVYVGWSTFFLRGHSVDY